MHCYDHGLTDKRKVPCWSPAEYPEGATRGAKHVLRVHLATLDADDLTEDEMEALAARCASYQCFFYTTWSHGEASAKGLNRFRVVFPLTRPVNRAEWQAFYYRFTAKFGVEVVDTKCSDASRMYFQAYSPPTYGRLDPEDSPNWVHTNTSGEILNPDAILALPAPPKTPRQRRQDYDPNVAEESVEIITDGHFKALRTKLQRRATPHAQNASTALRMALRGEALAEEGERDEALLQLCWAVAAEYPLADPESLVKVLTPSLDLMAAQSGGDLVTEQEKVRDKFARALTKIGEQAAEKQARTGGLDLTDEGQLANTPANLQRLLASEPEVRDCLGYNERANNYAVTAPLPWDLPGRYTYPRFLSDHDGTYATVWLAENKAFKAATPGPCLTALQGVCMTRPYDPVKDYLESLKWDGNQRLEGWLARTTGCEDTPYTRMVGRYFLLGAVARTYKPGCMVKYVPVFVGMQNLQKSSLLRALAVEWFDDSVCKDLSSKDAQEKAHNGAWILEIQEIDKYTKKEAGDAKTYISTNVDRFRPSYARSQGSFPRRIVIAASTNQDEFLRDESGNVRYWPIVVGEITIPSPEEVEQLWGETVALFKTGVQWWPERELEAEARPHQEVHSTLDPWIEVVYELIHRKQDSGGYGPIRKPWAPGQLGDGGTLRWVKTHQLLYIMGEHQNIGEAARVGRVLRKLGWYKRSDGSYSSPAGFYNDLKADRRAN